MRLRALTVVVLAVLLAVPLVLGACQTTPAAPPARRMPPRVPRPVVVEFEKAPPVVLQPAPTPPRPYAPSDKMHPAADPGTETSRIVRPVDGVAVAPSRSRRHHLRIDLTGQVVADDGSATLHVQGHLEPSEHDVVLGRMKPVRRFVTTDGYELFSPDQMWSVNAKHGHLFTQGIDIRERQRGLRDLDIDARIFEIRSRETVTAGPFDASEHETRLGPFPIRVFVQDGMLGISTWSDPGARRSWLASHAQPLIELDFEWVLDSLEVRDADARLLTLGGGGGHGGGAAGTYSLDDGSYGAPTFPVTVSLAVPASYRQEDTTFYFRDLPLVEMR